MSDEELMKRYQSGNEEAFNRLYAKYSPMVYGFIKKRLRGSEVDDFYQKVWRHLHEKRTHYKDQPFGPWFFVMIRHLLIDEYRSLGKRSEKDFHHELVEKIYQSRSRIEVEDELSQLPDETKALIEKYYLDEASYEDLEKETGLSQTNLRQRLSRSIRGLREKLRGSYEG